MGLSPEGFGQMRLNHFFLKLKGWVDYKQARFKEQAELVRMQTVRLVNIQLAKKDQFKDPSEMWLFPWDKEPVNLEELERPEPEKMKQVLQALRR